MHKIKLSPTNEDNAVTAVNSRHGNSVSAQEALKHGHVTECHCPDDLSGLRSDMVSVQIVFVIFR